MQADFQGQSRGRVYNCLVSDDWWLECMLQVIAQEIKHSVDLEDRFGNVIGKLGVIGEESWIN